MEPFTTVSAIGLPVDIANCDTDQIIPARFLKRPRSHADFPRYLFHDHLGSEVLALDGRGLAVERRIDHPADG